MSNFDASYDAKFSAIDHYQKYPMLTPWVGSNYTAEKFKLLLVAESHYLDKDETCYLNIEEWYDGIDVSRIQKSGWMNTRGMVDNYASGNRKSRSNTIYNNLTKALRDSEVYAADGHPFLSAA